MFSLQYGLTYKIPDSHQPPADDLQLASNTEYPNLNSRDYAIKPINRTLRMNLAWNNIAINEQQHIIIATNKLSGRECTGSLWGFEHADPKGMTSSKSCFKLQCNSGISKLQYATKDIFIVALQSGQLQLWSTCSEVRNPQGPYCLFLISEKLEHVKPIAAMDVAKANFNKAFTGDKIGTLKLWDMGKADLCSTASYYCAHNDVITALDSSPTDDSIFATCSLDKSALLWDDRSPRPATALYENHQVRFKDIKWAQQTQDPNGNLIYIGDESGAVFTVDKRTPNEFITSFKCFDRPIRKIIQNDLHLALIGDTNMVKIYKKETATGDSDFQVIYENNKTQSFIRDAVWRSSTELLTVGFESKMRVHKVPE